MFYGLIGFRIELQFSIELKLAKIPWFGFAGKVMTETKSYR